MTKVSKVYFGLSRAWAGAGRGSPGPLPPGRPPGRGGRPVRWPWPEPPGAGVRRSGARWLGAGPGGAVPGVRLPGVRPCGPEAPGGRVLGPGLPPARLPATGPPGAGPPAAGPVGVAGAAGAAGRRLRQAAAARTGPLLAGTGRLAGPCPGIRPDRSRAGRRIRGRPGCPAPAGGWPRAVSEWARAGPVAGHAAGRGRRGWRADGHRVNGHRELDVAAELPGQRMGDECAQPGLELLLDELVGRRDQRGVLDQAEWPGQPQPGPLVGFDMQVGELLQRPRPDLRQIGLAHQRGHLAPPHVINSLIHRLCTPHFISCARSRGRRSWLMIADIRCWCAAGSVVHSLGRRPCRVGKRPFLPGKLAPFPGCRWFDRWSTERVT